MCCAAGCTGENECVECKDWTEEEFAKYIKHRKALDCKSRKRKIMWTDLPLFN